MAPGGKLPVEAYLHNLFYDVTYPSPGQTLKVSAPFSLLDVSYDVIIILCDVIFSMLHLIVRWTLESGLLVSGGVCDVTGRAP